MADQATPNTADYIQVTRQGDIAVITPSPGVEDIAESALEEAAQMVLRPLRDQPPGGIIVDLTGINFVGSVFLSFLLRCHKIVKLQGSEMVLAGLTPKARELLRITALDTIWALTTPNPKRVTPSAPISAAHNVSGHKKSEPRTQ